jgi:hypothetical protein
LPSAIYQLVILRIDMNAFGKLRLLRNALGAPPPVAETRAAWWMAIGRAAGLLALALAAA